MKSSPLAAASSDGVHGPSRCTSPTGWNADMAQTSPPKTTKTCPETSAASSEAKKPIKLAMFAGSNLSKPSSVFGFSAILDGLLVAVPPSRVRHSRGCSLYAARLIDVPPEICEQLQCDPATCDRLHFEPEYVRQLRQQSSTACCAYCGDVFSRMILADVPALQLLASFIVDGVTFPIERLSLTCAIPILGFKPERTLRAEILCRHHLNGICSSGKDCPYFHICRHRPRNS